MGKALIFCGIKHCGKSTLGRNLARKMAVPFKDTDELLEERWQVPVREMFKTLGEEEFRLRESAMLRELDPDVLQVISLGGGALLKEENIPVLRQLGSLIWCDVDDRTAFERIMKGGLPPFLAQTADPFAEFQKRNRERREIFSAVSALHFEAESGKTPAENVTRLWEILLEKGMIEK